MLSIKKWRENRKIAKLAIAESIQKKAFEKSDVLLQAGSVYTINSDTYLVVLMKTPRWLKSTRDRLEKVSIWKRSQNGNLRIEGIFEREVNTFCDKPHSFGTYDADTGCTSYTVNFPDGKTVATVKFSNMGEAMLDASLIIDEQQKWQTGTLMQAYNEITGEMMVTHIHNVTFGFYFNSEYL